MQLQTKLIGKAYIAHASQCKIMSKAETETLPSHTLKRKKWMSETSRQKGSNQ